MDLMQMNTVNVRQNKVASQNFNFGLIRI